MSLRRKKYRLYRRMKANGLRPARGFRWRTNRLGEPARATLRTYQRFVGIPQTGVFDRATMDALFPGRFAARVVELARREVGVVESSPNWGDRVKEYLAAAGIGFPTAWCAAFCVYVLRRAGYRGPWPDKPAWVPSWASWARATGRAVAPAAARRGDLVCINWAGSDPTPDHIAVVTGNLGALKRLTTVGGNEGDAVREGWRPYWQAHTVVRLTQYRRR